MKSLVVASGEHQCCRPLRSSLGERHVCPWPYRVQRCGPDERCFLAFPSWCVLSIVLLTDTLYRHASPRVSSRRDIRHQTRRTRSCVCSLLARPCATRDLESGGRFRSLDLRLSAAHKRRGWLNHALGGQARTLFELARPVCALALDCVRCERAACVNRGETVTGAAESSTSWHASRVTGSFVFVATPDLITRIYCEKRWAFSSHL